MLKSALLTANTRSKEMRYEVRYL